MKTSPLYPGEASYYVYTLKKRKTLQKKVLPEDFFCNRTTTAEFGVIYVEDEKKRGYLLPKEGVLRERLTESVMYSRLSEKLSESFFEVGQRSKTT